MILLILFVISLTAATQEYRFADLGFSPLTDHCPDDGAVIPNVLATLRISNDLLGQRVTLSFDTSDASADYSCYLCARYASPAYCATALNSSQVYLSDDVDDTYNVQILDRQSHTLTSYSVPSDSGRGVFLPNLTVVLSQSDAVACGARLVFLVGALFAVELPNTSHSRDFLTLALDHAAGPESAISCEADVDASLLTQMSIDCAQHPFLSPIVYQTSQCIETGVTDPSPHCDV